MDKYQKSYEFADERREETGNALQYHLVMLADRCRELDRQNVNLRAAATSVADYIEDQIAMTPGMEAKMVKPLRVALANDLISHARTADENPNPQRKSGS